ncbi:hypothetical protein BIV57_10005 [Mangrovactinospora gilvigrisea]|uniref:DUF742 domain-containing protein n=1 Tax=Mangrovactinospora gilvigrisea TaxID=1428644 RepID=A0A1J7BG51_9ACTN|nr:DUF742 domain-containing protein [Mangrovactinospora gilvigrisea]OIV37630.1 hypothetical protein BIV57_10005 [Mangrovactinospora gilvigrisea]
MPGAAPYGDTSGGFGGQHAGHGIPRQAGPVSGYGQHGVGHPEHGSAPSYDPYGNQPAGTPAAPGGVPGMEHGGPAGDGYEDEGPEESLVRPYAMTGGRTRPRYQLAIEALVSSTGQQQNGQTLLPEHARIVDLCRQVKSVAEISALLSIPLGVARILVADLAEAGLVAIHQPGGADAGQPDVTLLERVLSGLRKL